MRQRVLGEERVRARGRRRVEVAGLARQGVERRHPDALRADSDAPFRVQRGRGHELLDGVLELQWLLLPEDEDGAVESADDHGVREARLRPKERRGRHQPPAGVERPDGLARREVERVHEAVERSDDQHRVEADDEVVHHRPPFLELCGRPSGCRAGASLLPLAVSFTASRRAVHRHWDLFVDDCQLGVLEQELQATSSRAALFRRTFF